MCGCWLETPESWHEGEPILKMSLPECNAFQALTVDPGAGVRENLLLPPYVRLHSQANGTTYMGTHREDVWTSSLSRREREAEHTQLSQD